MRSPPLSMTICICLSNVQVPVVNLFFLQIKPVPYHLARCNKLRSIRCAYLTHSLLRFPLLSTLTATLTIQTTKM
ncbi:uncharacterized protein EV420DRAFT_1602954, partial [Desarmillaria tabescens]